MIKNSVLKKKVINMRLVGCLFVMLLSMGDARVNYCGAKMCGHTNSHTFCRYKEGPGPQCTGYMEARLTPEEKSRILTRINLRRSAAASGKLRGLPSAGNMLKLRWVDELEREALRWADQCEPHTTPELHDQCRDLFSTSVGQCVASVVGESPGLRPESMVDIWYMQSMHYKGNVTNYEAPPKSSTYYGDFAQLVWANAYMVGCGRSRFMSLNNGRYRSVERLVCNFAPRGPTVGRPLWTMGAPSTNCPINSLPDPEQPGLCAYQYNTNELQDTEHAMALEEYLLLNTVLDIERNDSMNYLGSIDEIYLTNLAIVTMDSTQSTISTATKSNIPTLMEKTINNNASEIKNKSKNTFNKHNIKFIGRPKSYKIDELTDFDNYRNTENHVDVPDKNVQLNYTDSYGDYDDDDFGETLNETKLNASGVILDEVVKIASSTKQYDKGSTNIAKLEKKNPQGPSSTIPQGNKFITSERLREILNKVGHFNNNTQFSHIIVNASTTQKSPNELIDDIKLDEYLSDPDTVRRIQEELEKMENELVVSSTTSGKVRRDVRLQSPKEQLIPKRLKEDNDLKQNLLSDIEDNPLDDREITRFSNIQNFEKIDNYIDITRERTQNSISNQSMAREKRTIPKDDPISSAFPSEPAVFKMMMDYLPNFKKKKMANTGHIVASNKFRFLLLLVHLLSSLG